MNKLAIYLSIIFTLFSAAPAALGYDVPAIPAINEILSAHQEDGKYAAGLGDTITVHVQNLDTLLDKAKLENHQVILFLDGMPLKGCTPVSINTDEDSLAFLLQRTPESKETWNILLGKPGSFNKDVSVSVGFESGYTIPTGKDNFTLVIIASKIKFGFWLASTVAIIALFWVLSAKTPILRMGGQGTPYSLARAQMMGWTFVVVTAYLFIWIVVRDINSVNSSILILMGISGGTALGAVLVDANKQKGYSQLVAQRDALSNIIKETQEHIGNLPPEKQAEARNNNNDKRIRLGILEQKIVDFPLPDEENMVSSGFINDILSDSDGYSVHRLQMFVWTIIFIGIFINSVYVDLSMPEFDATLLALMGVSSGTYLGFKFPEK